jgi:hypothetical protein
MLSNVSGDNGTSGSGVAGLVPAPPLGSAAANEFLKADGTFQAIIAALTSAAADSGVIAPTILI